MSHIPTPIASALGGMGVAVTGTQTSVVNWLSQTASVTVANTTTETALIGAGAGSISLPTNILIQGATLTLFAWGYYGTKVVLPGSLTLRLKAGATTIATVLQGAVVANLTANQWRLDAIMTVRTVGVSGSLMCQALGNFQTGTGVILPVSVVNTAVATIDTTVTLALGLTAQWDTADAANTITLTNLVVR